MFDWFSLFCHSLPILNFLFFFRKIVNNIACNEPDLNHQGKNIPAPQWQHCVFLAAVLEVILEEGPECDREETHKHGFVGHPNNFEISTLFVFFDFRDNKVQKGKEPNVVLVCYYLIEENEVADEETLTVEERSMFNQVEREEG